MKLTEKVFCEQIKLKIVQCYDKVIHSWGYFTGNSIKKNKVKIRIHVHCNTPYNNEC